MALVLTQSCKKELNPEQEMAEVSNPNQKEIIKAQKDFGKEFLLIMKKDTRVKELLIEKCQERKYGDYYVRTQEFLSHLRLELPHVIEGNDKIEESLRKLFELERVNPTIFMPSAETREDAQVSLFSNLDNFEVLVPDFENPAPGDSYPGYVLNDQNQLVYFQHINEDFAWENNVIVIGYEEDLPLESMTVGVDDHLEKPDYRPILPNISRTPGREEWGGIVQVTNLGEIETWVKGAPDFKYIVTSSTGQILKNKAFNKFKRKHFKNNKWFNFVDFIGIWNISNWGEMHSEKWIELDGGNNVEFTYSVSSGPGQPGYSITIPAQDKDLDLGISNVQFTDPCLPEPNVTTYMISFMNFRRETK
jgi:hypothetical protein